VRRPDALRAPGGLWGLDNRKCIYILKILTHADYDKNAWKDTL
jgi:hypothetical protein